MLSRPLVMSCGSEDMLDDGVVLVVEVVLELLTWFDDDAGWVMVGF